MEHDPIEPLLRMYVSAWSMQDAEERRRTVQQVWAPDGCYRDPVAEVEGRDALVEYVIQFQSQFPGVFFEIGETICHHRRAYFSWKMLSQNHERLLEGRSFMELSPAGQVQSCTAFFNLPG